MSTSKDDDIKEKILNLAKKNPKGISDKDITAAIPDLPADVKVSVINKLLQQGNFDLYNQGGSLIYRYFFLYIKILFSSLHYVSYSIYIIF